MQKQVKQLTEQDEDRSHTLCNLRYLYDELGKSGQLAEQTDALINAIADVAGDYVRRLANRAYPAGGNTNP